MKKLIILFLITIIVTLVLFLFWWNKSIKPVSNDPTLYDFVITKGSSATQIAKKLEDEKLINNFLVFKIYIQLIGKQNKIMPGDYRFSPSFSLKRIVEQLLRGPQEISITIPEGLRSEEIMSRFIKALAKKDFEAGEFKTEFMSLAKNKEGYLFPDTYLFPKTASASAIINRMTALFDKKVDSKMKEDISKSGYSLEEIVTVASLIERETKTDEERPLVAGIIYKRLEAGWPLQIDASTQYPVGSVMCKSLSFDCDKWWEPLTQADLEIDSFYNTYKFPGLPPTPIANPGLSSIKAAIYPEDSSYWFYIHGRDGKIHFARTKEEHNENIKKYL